MITPRNGKAAPKRRRLAKATKAQIEARARFIRDYERRTGDKITQARLDALAAEIDGAAS